MARRRRQEEPAHHEAWAVPYGDLMTLLLAFFVVMYAVSSINAGKYRVLSDALTEAFGGPPKVIDPIQKGLVQPRDEQYPERSEIHGPGLAAPSDRSPSDKPRGEGGEMPFQAIASAAVPDVEQLTLEQMGGEMERALADLIAKDLVSVTRTADALEVEIRTDILFASGAAQTSSEAAGVLRKLVAVLRSYDNPLRVEGYTDNVPIRTAQFPSNWELSAARAANVVRLFMNLGIDPARMSVAGFGEFRPVADNGTVAGRNLNRRVVLVVLPHDGPPRQLARSRSSIPEPAP